MHPTSSHGGFHKGSGKGGTMPGHGGPGGAMPGYGPAQSARPEISSPYGNSFHKGLGEGKGMSQMGSGEGVNRMGSSSHGNNMYKGSGEGVNHMGSKGFGQGSFGEGMQKGKGRDTSMHSQSGCGKGTHQVVSGQRKVVQRDDNDPRRNPTLLRNRPTKSREGDVWLPSGIGILDGEEVEELARETAEGTEFSKVKAPGNKGYIKKIYLQMVQGGHRQQASVMRTDGETETLLRKIADPSRADHVWVGSKARVKTGDMVDVLSGCLGGEFAEVSMHDNIGWIQSKYLVSAENAVGARPSLMPIMHGGR